MSTFIDNFAEAFRNAFPIVDNFGAVLLDISDKFLNFSKRFKVVREGAESVAGAFTEVSDAIGLITAEDKKNALDIWNWGNINGNPGRIDGQDRVEALGESYDRVQKYINTFIETGYDVAKTDELLGVGAENAAKGTEKLNQAISESMTPQERQKKILSNLAGALHDVVTVIKTIASNSISTIKAMARAFADVFDPLQKTSDLKAVTGLFAKLAQIFEVTAQRTENMKRIFRGLFSAVDIVYQLVRTVVGYIGRALMPALDNIGSSGGGLLSVLGDLGDWIYELDQAIKQGDLFSVALDKMIGFISTLDDKVIGLVHAFEDWSGIDLGAIGSKIVKFFKMIFDKIYDLIGIDIGGMLSSLWSSIKTFFGYIKEGDFAGAFSFAAEGIKGFISSVVEGVKNFDFSKLKTAFGGIFGKIGEIIGGFFDGMWKKISKKAASGGSGGSGEGSSFGLLDILGGVLYGAYAGIKKIIETIGDLLSSDTAAGLWQKIKDFFSGLFTSVNETDAGDTAAKTKNFGDILVSIGHYLRLFFEEVQPIIGTLFGGSILKSVNDITTATKNFSKGPLELAKGMANLTDAFNGMQKTLKIETLTRFVKALGDVVIKFVIAIVALAILDHFKPDAISNGVYAITLMIGEIVGALMLVNQKMDTSMDMKAMAKFAKSIAWVIIELSAAFFILSKIPTDSMFDVTAAYSVMIGSLAGVMMLVSEIVKQKQFRRGGEGVLSLIAVINTIAKAMVILSSAMYILGKIDSASMESAIGAYIVITGALVALIYVISELAKKSMGTEAAITALGSVLMMVAGAMVIASVALLAISIIPESRFEQAIIGVSLLAALFAGLMFVASLIKGPAGASSILAAGAAMMMVALAMDLMLPALIAMALIKPEQLTGILKAFTLIIAEMIIALGALSMAGGANVALAGVGILALAAAIAILTPAVIAFGTWAIPVFYAFVDLMGDKMKDMAKAAGIIALIGAALIVAGAGVAVLSVGLLVFGVALNVISLATLLMVPFVNGLTELIKVIMLLAKEWDNIKPKIVEMGETFGTALGAFFGSLSDAIAKAEPEIRNGMLSFINILAMGFTEGIPAIVNAVLTMIANILIAIDDNLPTILLHLASILTQILEWLAANSLTWSYLLANIIINIIIGTLTAVTERLPEITEALEEFLKKLFVCVLDVLAMLLVELFKAIGNLFKMGWDFWYKHGADIIDLIVEGIKGTWHKLKEWVKSIFTEKIPAGLGDAWEAVKGWGENIIDSIISGIKSKWNEAKDTIAGFGEAILETLGVDVFKEHSKSKATEEMGEYLDEGIWSGVQNGEDEAKKNVYDSGYNILEEYGLGADDAMDDHDFSYNPEFDVNPNVNMDVDKLSGDVTKQMEEAGSNVSMDSLFSNIKPADENLQSLNWSAIMNQYKPTSQDDFQATMDDQSALKTTSTLADNIASNNSLFGSSNVLQTKSNELTEKLNGNMEKLVDSFKNGMINIPDNATFSTSINLDGRTIADATAPYLDVLNADRVADAERGVATR